MALLWKLNELRRDAFHPALFITLTYPAGSVTSAESKRHLDVFLKRLFRRFPKAAALWKLEYQGNGTAHYHLIVLGVDFWVMLDAKRCWAEVVKSNHPAHEWVGARIEAVLSQRQASFYMGKYVGKGGDYPEDHYGRVWGVRGDVTPYVSPKAVLLMDRGQYCKLRRLFDAIRRAGSRRTFKRASDLRAAQRWFIAGGSALDAVARLLADNPATLVAALGAPDP